MNKFFIIGASGCGKTTLANQISNKFKIPHFDLDDVFWKKKYTDKRSMDERIQKVSTILKKNKSWVIEGVFNSFVEEIFMKSDEVILIDIHWTILWWRIILRYFKNFGDKRTTFYNMYMMFKMTMKYKSKKGRYHEHMFNVKKHKVNLVVLKNSKEIKEYFNTL